MSVQNVQIAAQDALSFLDTLLPILEASIPAVGAAAGPIGLGVSAASVLLPLLAKIPIGQTYTVEQQQDYLNRIQALVLLDFSAPAWEQHPIPVPGPTPQAPG